MWKRAIGIHILFNLSLVLNSELRNRDSPGGTVVKSPPANAEDTGSIPGPGRFHTLQSIRAPAPQLLSFHSRAHELQLLKPVYLEPEFCNERSHCNEKPEHRSE